MVLAFPREETKENTHLKIEILAILLNKIEPTYR
jgi:hypothetical protein